MSAEGQPSANVLGRLGAALLVRPGEGRRTALCFAHLFTASAVFVLGRTVRDTLFLSRYTLDALPWMFVLYGVASAITVVLYGRLADRLSRSRTIVLWCGLGVVTYLGTWVAVHARSPWIYPTFYVGSEVFANLAISQFWTLANDLHDPRSARRLFGTIGAARVLGVVVVGLLAGSVVRVIGTEQLLFVLAALQILIATVATVLGGGTAKEPVSAIPVRPPTRPARAVPVASDRYVQALGLMLLFAFAALTIGDYQFKAIARATYHEDALAQFFSLFYAATGIVSFVFQLAVTPRLLARFGVSAGMSVMPAVFGSASALLLAVPELAIATVMKFADNGFQYTIHETTLQTLYVPFASSAKARTRAFLDAVVKPAAYGLGGVLLLLFAEPLGTIHLGLVSGALVLGWALSIPLVKARYRQKLESTLAGGVALDLGEKGPLDAIGQHVLIAALTSDDERRVLAALEEADAIPVAIARATVSRLVTSPSAAVRAEALAHLARLGPDAGADRAPIRAALDDPHPTVRGSAARALAALGREEEVGRLAAHLDDPERAVRTEVLSSVLQYCAFEGAMVGGVRLAALMDSESPKDREDAAHVLGALGRSGSRRLRRLLDDPDPTVRLSAVRAAREVPDVSLLTPLLAALGDARTESSASAALTAIGEPAVAALGQLLLDVHAPRRARLAAPRILRGVVCDASWDALRAAETVADRQLRLRVLSGLGRLRDALGRPPEPLPRIRAAIEREIEEAEARRDGWEMARGVLGSTLLDEAMTFSWVRARRRVLALVALRGEREPLRRVREGLDDPQQRANALELLDNALDPSLRGLVMPFFDDAPRGSGGRPSLAPPLSLPALAAELCRDPNPYIAMLTLERLVERRDPLAASEGALAAAHLDPLVREAAVRALGSMGAREVALPLLRTLREDPDPTVARHARRALERLEGAEPGGEPIMISTVEKLLALRTAPVFAKIPSEDLAPLARVAEVESHAAGTILFAEGEPGDALFVLVRGTVEVRHGSERLATLGTGEAFGEMAVLDASPRSATAVASTDVQVLRIDSSAFYSVLREQPAIAEGIIRTLSQRLREANEAMKAGPRA